MNSMSNVSFFQVMSEWTRMWVLQPLT